MLNVGERRRGEVLDMRCLMRALERDVIDRVRNQYVREICKNRSNSLERVDQSIPKYFVTLEGRKNEEKATNRILK